MNSPIALVVSTKVAGLSFVGKARYTKIIPYARNRIVEVFMREVAGFSLDIKYTFKKIWIYQEINNRTTDKSNAITTIIL